MTKYRLQFENLVDSKTGKMIEVDLGDEYSPPDWEQLTWVSKRARIFGQRIKRVMENEKTN